MHAFRAAVEAGDHAAMVATLADDVVFHSPVAHRPFAGKEATSGVLAAVLATFTDFRYTDELEGDGVTALVFRARVGTKDVEGLDLVRTNAEGLIDHFTVMLRPLSALVAMAEAMGPKVEGLAKAS